VDPFQTRYFSENLVAPGIEPGISGYVTRNSDTKPERRSDGISKLVLIMRIEQGLTWGAVQITYLGISSTRNTQRVPLPNYIVRPETHEVAVNVATMT
jgi:hypothetical protein